MVLQPYHEVFESIFKHFEAQGELVLMTNKKSVDFEVNFDSGQNWMVKCFLDLPNQVSREFENSNVFSVYQKDKSRLRRLTGILRSLADKKSRSTPVGFRVGCEGNIEARSLRNNRILRANDFVELSAELKPKMNSCLSIGHASEPVEIERFLTL